MPQFFIGFIIGMFALMCIILVTPPLSILRVQQELVKQGHGFYNPLTKEFVLKECK